MAKVPYYFPNLPGKFREDDVEIYPVALICALLRMFGTQTSGYSTLKTTLINQLIDDVKEFAAIELVPEALFEEDRSSGWEIFLANVDADREAAVRVVKILLGDYYPAPLNLFDAYFNYDNVQVDAEPSNPMSLETAKTYVGSIVRNPRGTDIQTILPQLTASDQIDFLDYLFLQLKVMPGSLEVKAANYYTFFRAFCENGYKQNIVPFLIMLFMSPNVDGGILVSLIDMMFSFTEQYTPDNFIMFSMPSGMTVEEFTARATKTNSYCVTGITPEAYTEGQDPDYLIKGSTLAAIGDAIRGKTGGTAELSPAEMAESITDELVKPSGTKSITANGTVDVSGFANAVVNVPSIGNMFSAFYSEGYVVEHAYFTYEVQGNMAVFLSHRTRRL